MHYRPLSPTCPKIPSSTDSISSLYARLSNRDIHKFQVGGKTCREKEGSLEDQRLKLQPPTLLVAHEGFHDAMSHARSSRWYYLCHLGAFKNTCVRPIDRLHSFQYQSRGISSQDDFSVTNFQTRIKTPEMLQASLILHIDASWNNHCYIFSKWLVTVEFKIIWHHYPAIAVFVFIRPTSKRVHLQTRSRYAPKFSISAHYSKLESDAFKSYSYTCQ